MRAILTLVLLFSFGFCGSFAAGLSANYPICGFLDTTNVATAFSPQWSCSNSVPNTDPCTWTGVQCISSLISSISLSSIAGSLPTSFGSLSSLQQFYLTSYSLQGTIPNVFSGLSVLTYFTISSTQVSGTIPSSVGLATNLNYFVISQGSLRGDIPTTLGSLTKLASLGFSYNKLSGTLPSALGKLSSITYMELSGNCLTGSIPSSIGKLSKLAYFSLYGNKMNGSLIEWTASAAIKSLSWDSNKFFGSIPSSYGNINQLNYFSIGENSLTGSIPSSIGKLTALTHISLASNKLTGPLIEWVPGSTIKSVFLGSNHLSGTIPSSYGALNLEYLYLSYNCLSGSIPSSLGNATKMKALDLAECNLQNSIPSSLGALVQLNQVYLSDNKFTGPIPSTFGGMSSMNYMYLSANSLSGTIPSSLGNMSGLYSFSCDRNKLSGTIPTSLGALTDLHNFHFSDNSLSGLLPTNFCSQRSVNTYIYGSNGGVCASPTCYTCNCVTLNGVYACTESPTPSPTATPTFSPTPIPTATPTFAPSASPTTPFPSAVPSASPTGPSYSPTISPTTAYPTPPRGSEIISFYTTFTLIGVNATGFDADPSSAATLISSTADTWSINNDNIFVVNATTLVESNLGSSSSSADVLCRVNTYAEQITICPGAGSDPSDVYDCLTDVLATSVQDGSFNVLLSSYATLYNDVMLASVTASGVSFEAIEIDEAPAEPVQWYPNGTSEIAFLFGVWILFLSGGALLLRQRQENLPSLGNINYEFIRVVVSFGLLVSYIYTLFFVLAHHVDSSTVATAFFLLVYKFTSIFFWITVYLGVIKPVSGVFMATNFDELPLVRLLDSTIMSSTVSYLFYEMVLIFSFTDLNMIKLLPWRKSKVSESFAGYPNDMVYRRCLFGRVFVDSLGFFAGIVALTIEDTPGSVLSFFIFQLIYLIWTIVDVINYVRRGSNDVYFLQQNDFAVVMSANSSCGLGSHFKSGNAVDLDGNTTGVVEDVNYNVMLQGETKVCSDVNETSKRSIFEWLKLNGITPVHSIPFDQLSMEVDALKGKMSAEVPVDVTAYKLLSNCLVNHPEYKRRMLEGESAAVATAVRGAEDVIVPVVHEVVNMETDLKSVV